MSDHIGRANDFVKFYVEGVAMPLHGIRIKVSKLLKPEQAICIPNKDNPHTVVVSVVAFEKMQALGMVEDGTPKMKFCGQEGCHQQAVMRFYWPGSEATPNEVCAPHGAHAKGIAEVMGFVLRCEDILTGQEETGPGRAALLEID